MWYKESVFYHIYPLGFCGAPNENDGQLNNRIKKIEEWIPYLQEMGFDALYLGPLFESDKHGYDTRDYQKLDCRLGTNEDFTAVCHKLHEAGIKVILDGVFNHVGRGFWAFQDVKANREQSPYANWFQIDFGGNSTYDDGFWYEGWEGHFELVKLNLHNPDVVAYLFESIDKWMNEFDIDGLRLDVAYMLDREFLKQLHNFTKSKREDFFLLGEMIHGEYTQIVNSEMTDSCTNYEAYKGLYSSFNDKNLYEIAHSLNRQFGPEQWTLYKGLHLVNFTDNHDTHRLASVLKEKKDLPLVYGLMYGMPGIPCMYYGSEWGIEGDKSSGDEWVRPCLEAPERNELSAFIAKLNNVYHQEKSLVYGDYTQVYVNNQQMVISREYHGEKIFIAVNMAGEDAPADLAGACFAATELLTGTEAEFQGSMSVPAGSVQYWKVK